LKKEKEKTKKYFYFSRDTLWGNHHVSVNLKPSGFLTWLLIGTNNYEQCNSETKNYEQRDNVRFE